MKTDYDAIIIGAGVIGAAVAFEMAKKGRKTLTVDAQAEAGHGSTSGSCAIIRVYYSTLEGTALAYEAYHYWRDWAGYLDADDERGLAEFKEIGTMVMKTDGNGDMKRSMALCDELSIPYQEWDEATIKQHLPHYQLDRFSPAKRPGDAGFGEPTSGKLPGAVFFEAGGYVTDPALSAHNLQRAAEAKGAAFKFNARVAAILRKDGRAAGVRLTSGEEITAPVVVNVGGPASAKLNAMAGVLDDMTITTKPLKQEVVHVPLPKDYFQNRPPFITSDHDVYLYTRPEGDDHLLIGSEDPPCDAHIEVDDPDSDLWRDQTEQMEIQAIRQAQRAPSLPIPNSQKGVVDLYDVSDDWIPIYDKSSLPGFYMACGTSGNQYKNAPMAGKMMAELVDYCEAGNDHDTAPLSIQMEHCDLALNIGFFSRKRAINKDSSFSVLG